MKEAYWGYWLIVLGIFIIVVLLLIQNFTSTNTQDFYLVKEITEAAMEDAVDIGYYREYGEPKINKEKFYESFIRRFAEEASLSTVYDIEFTEIYEAPPKVGVKVSSSSNSFSVFGNSDSFDIVNKIDAILEASTVDVVSKSTVTSSKVVSGSYTDYNSLISDDGAKLAEFGSRVCVTYILGTEYQFKVYRCGIPTSEGVSVRRFDASKEYCVAYDITDNTQVIEGEYAMFKDLLDNGRCY